jgi:exodeoxyribonuclease V gamma subunit
LGGDHRGIRSDPLSFDERMLDSAKALDLDLRAPFQLLTEGELDRPPPESVAVDELCRFFVNPVRGFLAALDVDPRGEEGTEVVDREPIDLDGLGEWSIKETLRRRLEAVPEAGAEPALRRRGLLPVGTPGREVVVRLSPVVRRVRERVEAEERRHGDPRPETLALDLPCRDGERGAVTRLVGSLPLRAGGYQIYQRVGSLRDRHLVELWIRHLALCASETTPRPWSISVGAWDETAAEVWRLGPVEGAAQQLGALMDLHRVGLRRPLSLMPATGLALARELRAGKPLAAARRTAAGKWSNSFGSGGEVEREGLSELLGTVPPWDPASPVHADGPMAFERLVETVFGPMLDALERSAAEGNP